MPESGRQTTDRAAVEEWRASELGRYVFGACRTCRCTAHRLRGPVMVVQQQMIFVTRDRRWKPRQAAWGRVAFPVVEGLWSPCIALCRSSCDPNDPNRSGNGRRVRHSDIRSTVGWQNIRSLCANLRPRATPTTVTRERSFGDTHAAICWVMPHRVVTSPLLAVGVARVRGTDFQSKPRPERAMYYAIYAITQCRRE